MKVRFPFCHFSRPAPSSKPPPALNCRRGRAVFALALVLAFLMPRAGAGERPADAAGQQPASRFLSPFQERDRRSFAALTRRLVSRFGVPRLSAVRGHRHAGIDLQGKPGEQVYAVAPGVVAAVYWPFPNKAVAVAHRLPDNTVVYSAYVHLEDIAVQPGDVVDENTPLGRLFNRPELKRARSAKPHLHLEIRRSMQDEGERSYTALTMPELTEYCLDPLAFLQPRMLRP